MESPNLHHLPQHHPPPQSSSSSSSSTPSVFPLPTTTRSWSPNLTLNNAGNLNPNFQEANPRSRGFTNKKDIGAHYHRLLHTSGLGYHQWASAEESCVSSTQTDHDLELQYSRIKEEIKDVFPCKFTEMLNSSSSTTGNSSIMDQHQKDFNALSEKLLLKTVSSSGDFYSTSTSQNFATNNFVGGGGGGGLGTGVPPSSRRSFCQIYPSINISNLNPSSSPLDMNMHSSDLLNCARFNGGLSQHAQDCLPRFDDVSFRLDRHMHQHHQIERSSCSSSNIPSNFSNGMAETKRPNTSLVESKGCQSQNVLKKSRLESSTRSSCPSFKVRKEKLGDRIAALQQLVAPFGKTDTASVLMEAIGYIKFLQNQVETLSVPYMKSSRNQSNRAMQGVSGLCEEKEEQRLDLRSRGLRLVPLSCMSCLAADAGGGVWQQQPDFGGATL